MSTTSKFMERIGLRVRTRDVVAVSSGSPARLSHGLDLATLRNWEQGRLKPDVAANTLLWTIARNPEQSKNLWTWRTEWLPHRPREGR